MTIVNEIDVTKLKEDIREAADQINPSCTSGMEPIFGNTYINTYVRLYSNYQMIYSWIPRVMLALCISYIFFKETVFCVFGALQIPLFCIFVLKASHTKVEIIEQRRNLIFKLIDEAENLEDIKNLFTYLQEIARNDIEAEQKAQVAKILRVYLNIWNTNILEYEIKGTDHHSLHVTCEKQDGTIIREEFDIILKENTKIEEDQLIFNNCYPTLEKKYIQKGN